MADQERAGDAGAGAVDDEIETRIDAAWSAAAQDPESDDAAARFIDVVLAEALICPIWEDADDVETSAAQDADQADGDDAVAPKMAEIDGRDTLLLFDTEERLAAFAEEPTSFVALPGYVFFEMIGGSGAQIALNLDVAQSSTVFDPASVDAVAAMLRETDETAALIDPRQLSAAAPRDVSAEMLAALSARLQTARDIATEAWLFEMVGDDGPATAENRPVLALIGVEGRSGAAQSLGKELARLAGARDASGMGVDIAVFAADDPALERIRTVGFGLLRSDD